MKGNVLPFLPVMRLISNKKFSQILYLDTWTLVFEENFEFYTHFIINAEFWIQELSSIQLTVADGKVD